MRIRSIISTALAVLMLLALVPVFAEPTRGEEVPRPDVPLEDYMNDYETYLPYYNGAPGFIAVDVIANNNPDYVIGKYAKSTNAGQANSTAVITSYTFHMDAGDELSFVYRYETEENYDFFYFTVNGSIELSGSGEIANQDSWEDYTYTAPSDGDYWFSWKYVKDSSVDYGYDGVYIDSVHLSSHEAWNRAGKGLAEGGAGSCISFRTDLGDYPFVALYGHSGLTSTNTNRNNSTSRIDATFWVEGASYSEPLILSFRYSVSSEQDHDKLFFRDNGVDIFNVSGTSDEGWQTYYYTIRTNGLHTFTWSYEKDGYGRDGDDQAKVWWIQLTGLPSGRRASSIYEGLNASNTNARLVFNTPAGNEGFVPSNELQGNAVSFASNNRYCDGTDAAVETVVNMAAGEKLSFEYYISSEFTNDELAFYANGQKQMHVSGWSSPEWQTFIFTAPTTGCYTFVWRYEKDDSNSHGEDMARIRNVRYIGSYHNGRTMNEYVYNSYECDRMVNFVTPSQTTYTSFMPARVDGFECAISCNKYYEDTDSWLIGSTSFMGMGDVVNFDYSVDSEATDKLTFYVTSPADSTIIFYQETIEGTPDSGWSHFQWVSTFEGACQFQFKFHKDGNIDEGYDRACIRNFYIDASGASTEPTLDSVLNADNTQLQLHFEGTGQFPFEVGADSDTQYYAGSTNQQVDSSVSSMICTANFAAGDTISFYYNVDSEPNYDWFDFSIDGNVLVHESGESGILLFTHTFEEGGSHTLEWTYSKDSSRSDGLDMVRIYNITVLRGSSIPGDADGDGQVTISDALDVLRYALGIIDSLPNASTADVDGDGYITILDALGILRAAMGLIIL